MAPLLLFDAYYRMECEPQDIPTSIASFIGPMRLVQMRKPIYKLADREDFYPKILARILPGGYALVFSSTSDTEVASLEAKYDLKHLWAFGKLNVYHKDRNSLLKPSFSRKLEEFYKVTDAYEYLLIYQAREDITPFIIDKFEHIFSAGNAHVFKQRHPSNTGMENELTKCKGESNK